MGESQPATPPTTPTLPPLPIETDPQKRGKDTDGNATRVIAGRLGNADGATRPGSVVGHDSPTSDFTQFGGQRARQKISAATRRKRHDQPNRLVRPSAAPLGQKLGSETSRHGEGDGLTSGNHRIHAACLRIQIHKSTYPGHARAKCPMLLLVEEHDESSRSQAVS